MKTSFITLRHFLTLFLVLGFCAGARAQVNSGTDICFTTALIPAFSPVEKENRSLRFGGADAAGWRASFFRNCRKTEMATAADEFARRLVAVPSPGGEG